MKNFIIEAIIDILGYNDPYILKDNNGYKTISGQYFLNQDWAKNHYNMLNKLSIISYSKEEIQQLENRLNLYIKANKKYNEAKLEKQIHKQLLYEQLNSIYSEIYEESLETYKEK